MAANATEQGGWESVSPHTLKDFNAPHSSFIRDILINPYEHASDEPQLIAADFSFLAEQLI